WSRGFDVEVPWYLGHTWWLSIEEQFYAVWPWLLLLLLRRYGISSRVALILGCGAVLVSFWRLWLASHGAPSYRMYNGFDTRADALLLGCMLAFVLHPKESVARALLARHAGWMAPLVSIVMFALGLRMNYEDIASYRYWQSIC